MNQKTPKPEGASIDTQKSAQIVRELAALLEETGLSEIEIEQDGMRLRVSRATAVRYAPDPGMPMKSVPPETAAPAAPHPGTVVSPMVGTVYAGPQPGAAPFVKVGDEVKAGQTLLIIEAMKTMNPIPAPRTGKVIEIFVRDAQPVEFGEPLLVIG